MNLSETALSIDVRETEFLRLLGMPAGHRAPELQPLMDWAREWYAEHGRPWVYARSVDNFACDSDQLRVEGRAFASDELCRRLRRAEADSAVLVAVSAGPEAEQEAHRRWIAEKPDEYYFLETYASAVTEHLLAQVGARICAAAEVNGLAVLPHYSPGYTRWQLMDQLALHALISRDANLPGPLTILDSGMLIPKKSQLGLFGITSRRDLVRPLDEFIPCRQCGFHPCAFRRVPYLHDHAGDQSLGDAPAEPRQAEPAPPPVQPRKYAFPRKALTKWSGQLLTLEPQADGGLTARFRYDGSTCSNAGMPLTYQYEVNLSPAGDGHRIRGGSCLPIADDDGYTFQCQFSQTPEQMSGAWPEGIPLIGLPLAEALDWEPTENSAGCLCQQSSRNHKWKIVYQTILFGLEHHDQPSA